MASSFGTRTASSFGLALTLLVGVGCGDIAALELDITFPSDEDFLRTRALRTTIREVPRDGSSGCAALWTDPLPMLQERTVVVSFPNQVDVLVANLDLSLFPALTLLVYGHPGIRSVTRENDRGETEVVFEAVGDPLVGGCVDQPIGTEAITERVEIPLFPAPPGI